MAVISRHLSLLLGLLELLELPETLGILGQATPLVSYVAQLLNPRIKISTWIRLTSLTTSCRGMTPPHLRNDARERVRLQPRTNGVQPPRLGLSLLEQAAIRPDRSAPNDAYEGWFKGGSWIMLVPMSLTTAVWGVRVSGTS